MLKNSSGWFRFYLHWILQIKPFGGFFEIFPSCKECHDETGPILTLNSFNKSWFPEKLVLLWKWFGIFNFFSWYLSDAWQCLPFDNSSFLARFVYTVLQAEVALINRSADASHWRENSNRKCNKAIQIITQWVNIHWRRKITYHKIQG